MLSAHNHRGELEKLRLLQRPPPPSSSSQSSQKLLNSAAATTFSPKTQDRLAFGAQIIIAILQASVAYHYYHDDDGLDTLNRVPLDADQSDDIIDAAEEPPWLIEWFNDETKKVVKIVELFFKGFLELVKALNEMGIMFDQDIRRRRKRSRRISDFSLDAKYANKS